jgi:hypothetical protein
MKVVPGGYGVDAWLQAIGWAKGEGIVSRVSNGLELCARQGGAGKTGNGNEAGNGSDPVML